MSGLLTHWINEKTKKATLQFIISKIMPLRIESLASVGENWATLPPSKTDLPSILVLQAI